MSILLFSYGVRDYRVRVGEHFVFRELHKDQGPQSLADTTQSIEPEFHSLWHIHYPLTLTEKIPSQEGCDFASVVKLVIATVGLCALLRQRIIVCAERSEGLTGCRFPVGRLASVARADPDWLTKRCCGRSPPISVHPNSHLLAVRGTNNLRDSF